MTAARWQQVKALFEATVERPPSERVAFLASMVAEDDTLQRDVEALLAADAAGDFSERWPLAPELLIAEWQQASGLTQPDGNSSPGLTSGSRLGNYDVVAPLGAGGMGEVYRAHDPRLRRDVAIKILPRAFTTDPERLARFEREARVLASLNHPHIAGIYGIEDTGTAPALVLELVDGPTLAERISAGRLALDEALVIASQIADAVAAAHDKGIIHRDLKPANVKLTSSGVVKVLDFGLAKTTDSDAPPLVPAQSPTITMTATRDGMVIGTAPYMSPEQTRGRPVDKRSDIWAFGCVLFEMLAGRKAFDRQTVSDTTTAVLESEPDWRALPAGIPASVRRLLHRCLEKDSSRRLRDIGDAWLELEDAIGRRRARSLPARIVGRLGGGAAIALVLATTALGIVVALLGRTMPEGAPGPKLGEPRFTQITSQSGLEWFPTLSPDGKWVGYGGDGNGSRHIFLQSTTGQTPIDLTPDSTDDNDQPAFSPDGEHIAFRSSRDGGGIFVMGRTGEAVRRLTRRGFRPTWSPDGKEFAFTTENADLDPQNTLGLSSLWVGDVTSGEQRQIGNVDAVLPSWSPHGNRIAYTTRGAIAGSTRLDVWTVDRSGLNPVAVTTDGARNWDPVWSPDGKYLYFVSGRGGPINLWRIPIDEPSGKTLGPPEPVTTPSAFVAHITISADGTRIAYSSILRSRNLQKLRIDPATGTPRGEPGWITTGSRLWANPDPSPDGKWVVFYSSVQPEGDLYVAHADGTGTPPAHRWRRRIDRMPRWSPDGEWIAFHSIRGKDQRLWKIRPDGSDLQPTEPARRRDLSRVVA